jgi:hypothetical protein
MSLIGLKYDRVPVRKHDLRRCGTYVYTDRVARMRFTVVWNADTVHIFIALKGLLSALFDCAPLLENNRLTAFIQVSKAASGYCKIRVRCI